MTVITDAKFAQARTVPPTAHVVPRRAGKSEWYTPAAYVEAARRVLGEIDLESRLERRG